MRESHRRCACRATQRLEENRRALEVLLRLGVRGVDRQRELELLDRTSVFPLRASATPQLW